MPSKRPAAPSSPGLPRGGARGELPSPAEISNRMVWQGESGRYEVWFFTLFHAASGTGFWIRYTLESPDPAHGDPYVELWFARGCAHDFSGNFGIHRRFPLSVFSSAQVPFALQIGDSELRHNGAVGQLQGDGHDIRWELHWEPQRKPFFLLPSALYRDPLHLAETLVLSPNHSVSCRGFIEVDGQKYELNGAPLGQSHLWGRKHAYGWGWGRCNAFDTVDGESVATATPPVLEALTVRMRRGPVVVPLTQLAVNLGVGDGDDFQFTDLQTMALRRGEFRTGSYVVSAMGAQTKVEAQFACRPDDMIRTEYVDPDGTPAYCHFAAAASCQVTLSRRRFPGAPWQLWRRLSSQHGAQFEWAGRAGDSMVRRTHTRVE